MKTKIVTTDSQNPEPELINEAALIVRDGGLVGFPTETVYGIACRAHRESLARLDAIKGGLAGSNVMNAKGPMMFERNFAPGFRIELHYKDINNAVATANELDLPLQVTAT